MRARSATARACSACRRTRWRTSGTATWSPWAGGTTSGSTRASLRGWSSKETDAAQSRLALVGGARTQTRSTRWAPMRCAPRMRSSSRSATSCRRRGLRSADHLSTRGSRSCACSRPISAPDAFRGGIRSYIKARALLQRHHRRSVERAQRGERHRHPRQILRPGPSRRASRWSSSKPAAMLLAQRTLRAVAAAFPAASGTAEGSHWSVPLQIRSGSDPPQHVLLQRDGQSVIAGRCGEP